MLFVAIFPPGQRACNFDPSADRNVFSSRLCDRLRLSPIQLSLRSSAIIWKALTSFFLCASPCHQSRKKKMDERKCLFPCLAYCCIQKQCIYLAFFFLQANQRLSQTRKRSIAWNDATNCAIPRLL